MRPTDALDVNRCATEAVHQLASPKFGLQGVMATDEPSVCPQPLKETPDFDRITRPQKRVQLSTGYCGDNRDGLVDPHRSLGLLAEEMVVSDLSWHASPGDGRPAYR